MVQDLKDDRGAYGGFLPETAVGESITLPRLGAGGWARWGWRQLTSMRVALFLLLLLAVAAVPGSVFPQRRIDAGRVQAYLSDHTTTGPWLDRLGFLDVYSSPWFSAVYLLLFVSLVGCVLPRSRKHLQAIRATPPRTPRRLQRMPEYDLLAVDTTTGPQALAAARAVLRGRRYRVAEHDGGSSLAAERGYLAETGNLAFHLALVALLTAVGAGAFTGYAGQVLVVEGESFANVLPAYNNFTAGSQVDTGGLPPFAFTLDSLKVRFESSSAGQMGAARAFDATVTVREHPGAAPRTQLVQVNHPLEVDGAKAYLVGNGYAPVVTVKDGSGQVVFRGPVPALVQDSNYTSSIVIKVPDAQPRQIALVGSFLPTALLQPGQGWISIFPDDTLPLMVLTAFVSAPGQDGIGVNGGAAQSVYVLDVTRLTQLRTTDGEPARLLLKKGAAQTLPDGAGSISFDGLKRYAAFDVRSDPTKGWALGAALVALAGVTASLFVRRRRLWVRVSEDDQGRTVVEVAGLARGEDAGLGDEVKAVLVATARERE
ncbi:MAG TPA: cytochrome c biogenesis protein ResB [Kineosporiaceae bacterium]|nr:cytochrome c biogenesis protein ResB [Kineosporiaceae bacterium]